MIKLIVVFCNFANAPKTTHYCYRRVSVLCTIRYVYLQNRAVCFVNSRFSV